MRTMPYVPQHMIERTERVKNIWIKEYERERRGKIIAIIPTVTAYSVGFWSGSLGNGVWFWIITVFVSVCLWYGFRYLRTVYKINI